MKKRKAAAVFLCCLAAICGCGSDEPVQTDGYQYLIGVSLTNVMEPWLNNLAHILTDRAEQEGKANFIFRDAAGSTEKQIQDVEALMEYGIDLLIITPDTTESVNTIIETVSSEIPVVAVGTEPETDTYASVIQADDEGIGQLAGKYIAEELYDSGDRVVVIEGVKDSPISDKRLKGFQKAVEEIIPENCISYYVGDWLRDSAELRMKDYLVENGSADIVFAFNDEMAYGAYLACQQFRIKEKTDFIGVDGFDGEVAGRNLVERGILNATIQSPDFGALAYDTAMGILEGRKTEKNIMIVPEIITGENTETGSLKNTGF